MLMSSIAECLNSYLRHARQIPVTVLIEFIRDMMQKWFHDCLNHAKTLRTQLTTWVTTLLNQRNEESTMFMVRPIDGNEFLVKDGGKDGLVNLIERTCTCQEFQIYMLPCKHALAALRA
ncbi:hypothetical protein Ddye_011069 [Dipteronia dyeriana]|uniref:SWIM-type domain-containing protein n=1 Tax=Dipteronia dyeriana TaxID=168575 RepID=A0AAE0CNU9_9ROSI|nr:hypothetical protein Ddye_011069 [Dipteronia dyeriana]